MRWKVPRAASLLAAAGLVLSGCPTLRVIDHDQTPIRTDLVIAYETLFLACNERARGEGDPVVRVPTKGQPLLRTHRRSPDAEFRYFGDELPTTARSELEELLRHTDRFCPRLGARIRAVADA